MSLDSVAVEGAIDRLWSYTVVSSNGCWLDLRPGQMSLRYPQIRVAGKLVANHRLSAVRNLGYDFDELKFPHAVVAHRCDNTRCWNPNHLFVTTQAENNVDCRRKGRAAGRYGDQKMETCQRGHKVSADWFKPNPKGGPANRRCSECYRDKDREYAAKVYAARKAAGLPLRRHAGNTHLFKAADKGAR